MGVSEIGRALDLSRSTAHRYVATLAALGYLQQDRESKRYRLGPRVLDLGFSAINSMDVREISAPAPAAAERRDGPHRQHGDPRRRRHRLHRALPRLAPGQREIDLNLHIGARLPAYCTAMGKAMLAFLPEDRLIAILDDIELAERGPTRSRTRRRSAPSSPTSARRASRSTTRSSRTACARSLRRSAPVRRSGSGAEPRRPPFDGR